MRILIFATLFGAILLNSTCAKENNMDKIVIIPEPQMSEDFEVDIPEMTKYYNELFEGKTAQEVVDFLENQNAEFKFLSDDRMMILPRKVFTGFIASYSCSVKILFKNGKFVAVDTIEFCGLDA